MKERGPRAKGRRCIKPTCRLSGGTLPYIGQRGKKQRGGKPLMLKKTHNWKKKEGRSSAS